MLLETIKNRRAVFPADFASDASVSRQEIEQLLEAANWAPTHRRTEPWRFKVFQGASQEMLADFIADKYLETAAKPSKIIARTKRDKVTQSGAIIAICMQRDLSESVPEWEELAAVAMSVQNMWLMTQELNLGGYWSSPACIHDLAEIVSMQEGESCIGFFYLGRVQEKPTAGTRKTTAEEKTTWL